MAVLGYIRTRRHVDPREIGRVLGVSDNPNLNNPEVVHVDDARAMVNRGDSEWVEHHAMSPESPQERAARQQKEREELDAQHAAEHRNFVSAHFRSRETPETREMRHVSQQGQMMMAHAAEQRAARATGAGPAELDQLRQAQAAALAGLIDRQQNEGREQAAARIAQHAEMTARHNDEHAAMMARHQAENAGAALVAA